MEEPRNALGFVPWPEGVRMLGGEWRIPDRPVISYGPVGGTRFAAQDLAKALRAIGRRPLLHPSGGAADISWLLVSDAEHRPAKSELLAGDESYRVDVTDHAEIRARSAQGAFYGAQTLAQAIAAGQGTLPKCEITDRPRIGMRGIMVDLGRLKEKDEYYLKLIDFMSRHKLNTLFLHLADDEGAPVQFNSHPKLAGPHALTRESIKKLVDHAAKRHIDIIPEIEVWGHAGWVTNHPDYAGISEGGPDLCTTNPKTWEFIGDLLDEICDMFPSKYIHGGCDEAIFGLCPACRAEVEARGADHLVGLHLKRTAEMIHERGRIPILWGDILLKYPSSADMVPKYTVINHWDYDPVPPEEPVKLLQDRGFTVLGSPALVCRGRAVLPLSDSLRNVESFGQVARKHKIAGINNTIWAPGRYVSDTLWYGIALAAEASWSRGKPDRPGLTISFFRSFFGIDAESDLIDAVQNLHEIPAYVGEWVTGLWRDRNEFDALAVPEASLSHEALLFSILKSLKTLRAYRRKVIRHRWEYNALICAASIKKHICGRGAAPGRLVQTLDSARRLASEGETAAASKLLAVQSKSLARLAEQEHRVAAATERYWDKWRYKDDPKKSSHLDNILSPFRMSDAYLITLVDRLTDASEQLKKGETPDWDMLLAI